MAKRNYLFRKVTDLLVDDGLAGDEATKMA
jgi:hypothetical protein